jgi:hypothetical protein
MSSKSVQPDEGDAHPAFILRLLVHSHLHRHSYPETSSQRDDLHTPPGRRCPKILQATPLSATRRCPDRDPRDCVGINIRACFCFHFLIHTPCILHCFALLSSLRTCPRGTCTMCACAPPLAVPLPRSGLPSSFLLPVTFLTLLPSLPPLRHPRTIIANFVFSDAYADLEFYFFSTSRRRVGPSTCTQVASAFNRDAGARPHACLRRRHSKLLQPPASALPPSATRHRPPRSPKRVP